jgi:hypothetical protein
MLIAECRQPVMCPACNRAPLFDWRPLSPGCSYEWAGRCRRRQCAARVVLTVSAEGVRVDSLIVAA